MEEMKILFYGDSITDASRSKNCDIGHWDSYGTGYVRTIAGQLLLRNPKKYTIINRGTSGNRIVDLYAKIKADVWNHKPDVLSILAGINDLLVEAWTKDGVDIVRFEKVYRMLIEDTLKVLPNVKIVLLEPFVFEAWRTKDHLDLLLQVKDYAKVIKKIAQDFNLIFIPLQEDLGKKVEEFGLQHFISDGIHPNAAGEQLIAEKWIKVFDEKIDE